MSIQFNGEEYYIRGPVNRGEKILVDYDYFDINKIRTWKKDTDGNRGALLENTMVTWNKHRERDNAVQIGKEYKRLPDTPVQVAMKEMDSLDYSKVAAAAFGHDLEKISEKIAYIERAGTEIKIDEGCGTKDDCRGAVPAPFRDESTPVPPDCGLRNADGGFKSAIQNPKSEIALYSRQDIFKEIRFRLKLERITPVQSQLIEQVLGERQMVEDAVIDEICRIVGTRCSVSLQTENAIQTVKTAQAVTA
jgi:hypothetical protein